MRCLHQHHIVKMFLVVHVQIKEKMQFESRLQHITQEHVFISTLISLPPYHAAVWWGWRRHWCDGDPCAQSLDHWQNALGHVGGIVALVLPAAQLCRQNVSSLSGRRGYKKRYLKKTWVISRNSAHIFITMVTWCIVGFEIHFSSWCFVTGFLCKLYRNMKVRTVKNQFEWSVSFEPYI